MTDLYGDIPISGGNKKKSPPSQKSRVKKTPPPPKSKQKVEPGQGKGKLLIIPVVIVLLLITYYGSTTLFIPFYLQKKLPALFQEKTGLSLEIGSVNFNPLKTAVIVENTNISTININSEKNDLLHIDTIYLDLELAALFKQSVASESLLIKGALFTITKYGDGTYNISSFLPQASTDPSSFFNLSNVPFLYSLNNIVVSESSILFEDISSKKTHRIEDIQLSLPKLGNFSYDIDNYIQPGFSAVINGSPIQLTSDTPYTATGSADDSSKLSLSLKSVDLPLYASYIPAQLPVNVKEGNADIDVEIAFKAQQKDNFRLNLDFQAQIKNGLFESNDRAITLETPALRLEGSIMPLARQIHLNNVLFRDPVVTVLDSLSASTMTDLLLQKSSSEKTNDDFFHSSSFDVSLLIADNGKCIVKSKKGERLFRPFQLSIKNFVNAKFLAGNPATNAKPSFRLSGESGENNTSFTWQGNFIQSIPTGSLEVTNLPVKDFFTIISPNSKLEGKGSAEIRGKLSFGLDEQSPLAVYLDKGVVQLSSLSLKGKENSILQSSEVKLSPFQVDGDNIHLGNIFLKGATLQIDKKSPKLPIALLSEKSTTLQGVDFQGTIVVDQKENKNPLKIENVHLQITDLEKPKKDADNVAFSATVGSNGSLSGKGRFSISPVAGEIEIAAANMPAALLLTNTSNSGYIPPTTMANVAGRYDFPSQSFVGKAEISKGEFKDSQQQNTYTFEKAVFGKFSIDNKTGRYGGEKVLFKDFTIRNNNYNLHSDGVSISSFTIKENATKIDSLDFANVKINCQNDFSKLFSSLQQNAGGNLSISTLHLLGSLSIAEQNQQSSDFIDKFDLTIQTPDGTTAEKKDIELKVDFADQGRLSASGTMQLQPLQVQVDMALNRVSSKVLHHFPTTLGKSGLDTLMSGEINFSYPEKIFAGDIQFDQGNIADKSAKPVISWENLDLRNFKLGDSPFALQADRLSLNKPKTTFKNDNSEVISTLQQNVISYLQELANKAPDETTPDVRIQRIDFNDGLIDYNASSFSPPWQTSLTSVNGYINNFKVHESDETLEYSFQGKIADASFAGNGTLSTSLDGMDNKTSFKLTSFPLAQLDKQLGHQFDMTFTESILDISYLKQASADEYFIDLALTSPKVDEYDSPTALTLALLSENSDKLLLSVPGKKTSPSLFSQINNYFQRLIVKCSVSPFLLLEAPYDTLKDRNSISFAPGKTELTMDSRDTLLDFSSLLEKHPQLQLILGATVQRSADTKALQTLLTEAERKRVQKENDKLLLEWQQQRIKTDVSTKPNNDIAVEDISEENLAEYTPKTPKEIVITDAMLKELGTERAHQIRKYILDQTSISEDNIAIAADVSIIDTLDMPEVIIRLGHIGKITNPQPSLMP